MPLYHLFSAMNFKVLYKSPGGCYFGPFHVDGGLKIPVEMSNTG